MCLLLNVHVLPTGAAENTCKQRETVQPDIPFVFGPTVHYSTAPPSLKSIFIFAVLTFSSSSQRHNDWLPAAAATRLRTVRADTTQREERSYCSPAAPPSFFLPKKIVVAIFFPERNRGTNARDRRGLNLQAKCVVTERNVEPSI